LQPENSSKQVGSHTPFCTRCHAGWEVRLLMPCFEVLQEHFNWHPDLVNFVKQ